MDIIIISFVAFLVSILTFFSGFGLGTILTPVMMIFFPVEIAIALTGLVHFFNNVFKLFLVGKNANKTVLIRFGIPAVIAAMIGAWVLLNIPDTKPLYIYEMFGKTFEVYPVKFVISILLIIFACMDLLPYFNKLQFGKEKLPIGGALSGFFGGLSGNQGALRTAFLIKAGLSKEAFIGTAVIVSTFVDFTRLSVYATRFTKSGLGDNLALIICATLSAIAGAYIGNILLKKVTLHFLQVVVAIMLILISIALGAGWI
ncbi:sulfite exporter TauE/SafE family protein [Aquimarina sp. 2201CG5-10]|uniref:sulfite exporter TauE/SafE family protein n=1 Tax=Aquimarina callyspongiae TaxID=3098150 RepID=UPI002AB4582C|nr:sulfite exporter TauE/SafE family protein [Aquimarina sp. 2201CG5-10]MDY8138732.1 sulfite exporter TauE/SafE family protein [Aquimarina sp. 2201CG5-10]